jgi:DNA polymerase III epsilon subunit-like protein
MRDREVYISVDIEASGPVPPDYSMLAIGACLVDDPSATFYRELKPLNQRVDPSAMAVVGRDLSEFSRLGEDPARVMGSFRDWITTVCKSGNPTFVGFNAVFDWAFVNYYFWHFVQDNPFGPGGIDIKSLYMGMSGSTWDDTKASALPSVYRHTLTKSHNALTDAVEQATVFRMLIEKSRRNAP